MDEGFEMIRSERRSFNCPNKLWKELQKQTNDCISISTYIRQAIITKLINDHPEIREQIEELIQK